MEREIAELKRQNSNLQLVINNTSVSLNNSNTLFQVSDIFEDTLKTNDMIVLNESVSRNKRKKSQIIEKKNNGFTKYNLQSKNDYDTVVKSITQYVRTYFKETRCQIVKKFSSQLRKYGIYLRFYCKEFFSCKTHKRKFAKCRKLFMVNYFHS